ncbi:cobalt-precorrin-6A reductase [Dietzia psychralcaliphila]|uniref:cobalt-precorrin-6A reductase n=1 Tax=Dietzia psychralcaliphila TaxID=139021 RepID=UPI000D302F95|nr:cobalt-precorrin-6A reductase [Dietzia psychralcaliphila]PTM88809.1 precorrin-6x reductase [Dietzia psychralcaliphila]
MTARFIGVGPGSADLLTVRATRLIAQCGTCLFEGDSVTPEVLDLCPPAARLVDTTGMPLADVIAEIRSAAQREDRVVRLFPGDSASYPGVFEETRALDAEHIGWQIVPGVPVVAAAAAALGVELTGPHGPGSAFITRVDDPSEPLASITGPASPDLTVVLHVRASHLAEVTRELIPAYGPDCPAGIVVSAGGEGESTVVGTLADIADRMVGTALSTDVVMVVGRILGLRGDDDEPAISREPGPASSPSPGTTPEPTPPSVVPTSARIPAAAPGRILVLGGTGEARRLADLMVAAGLDVVTSLAGKVSRPRLPRGEVLTGGFGGTEGLITWLRAHDVSAVIDATDPFSAEISASAIRAAHETGVPLLRVHRPPWTPEDGDDWIRVADTDAAAQLVRQRFRRPMLTVGRHGPTAFAGDTRGSYLIRCAEPPPGTLPHRYLLVLDRGPFGVESERTIMSRHRIDVLVTRNSGGPASIATLRAARDLRIPIVMVDRPADPHPAGGGPDGAGHLSDTGHLVDTVHSVDDAARWLVRRFGSR